MGSTITPEDLFDWRDHRRALEAAGYKRRAPGAAASIDGPIARSVVCPICDRQMDYWPVSRPRVWDSGYRAFAVCVPCDKALEF